MNARAVFDKAAMSPVIPAAASPNLSRIIDPAPLVRTGRNWTKWLGPLVSVLILVVVAWQLRRMDIRGIAALMPMNGLFWAAFIAYYFAGPISEWIIFRRLWSLPVDGFPALLRKLVSNEILLGYLGEVYFYAWARRHTGIVTAPFGAVKDVAVLSALMGNLLTLVMIVISVPLLGLLHLGLNSSAVIASLAFLLALSAATFVMRKRLFTLPLRDLWFVAGLHTGRIVVMIFLAAVLWNILLPAVAVTWWLLLATVRQLLSRLPFLPNKDVAFAGVAAYLVGPNAPIAAAITLVSTLIVAAHLLVGGFVGLSELIGEDTRND
ncbi:MAG: hypothetical protein LBV50_03935 [Novosphingobium sp.]|jgi:hypothetical protein|nr:hypothetical protein [Novosphingobium sp.]